VAKSPVGDGVRELRGWAHRSREQLDLLRKQARGSNVLEILDTLESSHISYLVAGGWGVDALLGHQTRKHRDLDVVLPGFEVDEPKARQALSALGFTRRSQRPAGIWMPIQSLLVNRAGHQIELLSIDLDRIGASLGQTQQPEAGAVDTQDLPIAASGAIEGRRVPCLSIEVQLLAHSGYEARPSDQRDVHELEELRDALGKRASGRDG